MLHTDLSELTTTLTTSLVKEFRLLQELVDTLREERQAFNDNRLVDIHRTTDLKEVVVTEILNNVDQRKAHKETLARLLGLEPDIPCRELAKLISEDEAAQILNLIEGSMALWNVAEELNKCNAQFIKNVFQDYEDTEKEKSPFVMSLEQCNRLDPVIFSLKRAYE